MAFPPRLLPSVTVSLTSLGESSSETFQGGRLTPPPLLLITLCCQLATYECILFNVIDESM